MNVVGNLRFDWWNGHGAIDFQLEDFVQTLSIESLRVKTILQSASGLQDLAELSILTRSDLKSQEQIFLPFKI